MFAWEQKQTPLMQIYNKFRLKTNNFRRFFFCFFLHFSPPKAPTSLLGVIWRGTDNCLLFFELSMNQRCPVRGLK